MLTNFKSILVPCINISEDFDSSLLFKDNRRLMLALADDKFCDCRSGDLDFSLEKMQIISHAGRNLQCTLCPMLTLTIASVEKKMLM